MGQDIRFTSLVVIFVIEAFVIKVFDRIALLNAAMRQASADPSHQGVTI